MEQVISSQSLAEQEKRSAREFRRRFWLMNFYLFLAGGAGSSMAALMLALLTALGVLDSQRAVGLSVTGLIVVGLSALLWTAHAMDRLAALKMEER